jgi:hypothetical protein
VPRPRRVEEELEYREGLRRDVRGARHEKLYIYRLLNARGDTEP